MDGAKNDAGPATARRFWQLPSTCKNPEAAMKFMDYFFNSDEAEKTLACVRSVPPDGEGPHHLREGRHP